MCRHINCFGEGEKSVFPTVWVKKVRNSNDRSKEKVWNSEPLYRARKHINDFKAEEVRIFNAVGEKSPDFQWSLEVRNSEPLYRVWGHVNSALERKSPDFRRIGGEKVWISAVLEGKKHMSFWSRYNIQTSIFAQQLQKLLIGHTFHW